MRTPLWLSIALFTAFVVIGLGLLATPVSFDRQQTMATARPTHVPEVASPTDLTVVATSTTLSTQRTFAHQKSTPTVYQNAVATGDESGMGRTQQIADVVWSRAITMQVTAAPQLALSWRPHENSGTNTFGVLKIS